MAGWNIFHKCNSSVICIKLTINGNVSCCYRYLHNLILISQALFNYASRVKSLEWLQIGFWSLTGQEKLKLSGSWWRNSQWFSCKLWHQKWHHHSDLTSPDPTAYCCLCVVKLKPSPCPPAVLSKAQLWACVLCNLAKSSWLTHGAPSSMLQGPQSGQLSAHRFGRFCGEFDESYFATCVVGTPIWLLSSSTDSSCLEFHLPAKAQGSCVYVRVCARVSLLPCAGVWI